MMITGAHSIIYSRNADADRAFFHDVLALPSVDVGGGWLIFGLPPAEVAVHPSQEGDGDGDDRHELYLLCDDVSAFVAAMAARNVACGPVQGRGWGLLTEVTLPGGGKLGVYQPRHARPPAPDAGRRKVAAKPKAKPKPKPKPRVKPPGRGHSPRKASRAVGRPATKRR